MPRLRFQAHRRQPLRHRAQSAFLNRQLSRLRRHFRVRLLWHRQRPRTCRVAWSRLLQSVEHELLQVRSRSP
jgi:hypothetical protein